MNFVKYIWRQKMEMFENRPEISMLEHDNFENLKVILKIQGFRFRMMAR